MAKHRMPSNWYAAPVGAVWLCPITQIWWRKVSESTIDIEMVARKR